MQGYGGLLLVVLGVVMGCVSANSISEVERSAAGQMVADQVVPFFDAAPFDREVSVAMGAQAPTVTVPLLAPTTVNAIPPRLGTWLAAVKERGGKVSIQPDPEVLNSSDVQARGWIDDGVLLLWRLVQAIRDWQLYQPAAQYDVTLYYRSRGELTKVVFIKK